MKPLTFRCRCQRFLAVWFVHDREGRHWLCDPCHDHWQSAFYARMGAGV